MIAARIAISLVLLGGLGTALPQSASTTPTQQTGTQQQTKVSLLVGSIATIDGKSITVKPDSGAPTAVTVNDSTRVLRTLPGAKTVAGATPIPFSDLAVGDRVLIAIHRPLDGSAPIVTTVVAMKKADIAQKQQAEESDWQRRGVGGLVKTVDAATGTVTIAVQNHTLTIHATPKTEVRRYDPKSIKFSDAKPSTLDQIHPGDQLRARGDRNADGSEMQADEIVAGSFRNIAGTVASVDPAANTVTVTDLATKKPIVIRIVADSLLHKLPDPMAQLLAARFKNRDSRRDGRGRQPAPAAAQPGNASAGSRPSPGREQHTGNLSQILERAPTIQLSDLHKGDIVMIVATQGVQDTATACTLLAGAGPILAASPSTSESVFSASWNLGGQGSSASAGGMPSTDR